MPTFETPGHVKLDLIVPAGAVTVGPWGEPRVEISVTPIRGDDASVQAAAETRIEAVERGGRHEVSVRVPKREGRLGIFGRSPELLVAIRCPEAADLELTTHSADLDARGPLGEVAVRSASGDVTAGDAASLSFTTASGDLVAGAVSGSLTTKSASGDVAVRSVVGPCTVGTVSGDVRLGSTTMTVAENVATVPRLLGWRSGVIDERVDELLDLVELPAVDYRDRYTSQLSGGERQRVGLARALAADPPVMLMDEPFGALDPITRTRLQHELLRIHGEVRKTVIFVTHDIDEAILMGDRIAILRPGGRLAQYDTPQQILDHPVDEFVANFVGRDRALKALTLKTVGELELSPATGDGLPRLPADTSLRDALAIIVAERRDALLVVGPDGSPLGVVTREDLLR